MNSAPHAEPGNPLDAIRSSGVPEPNPHVHTEKDYVGLKPAQRAVLDQRHRLADLRRDCEDWRSRYDEINGCQVELASLRVKHSSARVGSVVFVIGTVIGGGLMSTAPYLGGMALLALGWGIIGMGSAYQITTAILYRSKQTKPDASKG